MTLAGIPTSLRANVAYGSLAAMRALLILATAGSLAACATAPPPPGVAESLMDEVERSVRLPEGAEPLERYARYYGWRRGREIVARYIVPLEPPDPSWTCSNLDEDMTLTDVPCEPFVPDLVGAGRRRWMADGRQLPMRSDGGCEVVHIFYDAAKHRVKKVFCNGYA